MATSLRPKFGLHASRSPHKRNGRAAKARRREAAQARQRVREAAQS